MPGRVKLSDVVFSVENGGIENAASYLDLESEETEWIGVEAYSALEKETSLDEIPNWLADEVAKAREREKGEEPHRYLRTPEQYGFHEYRHMERFVLSLKDQELSDELYRAIKGKGSFHRFKRIIHQRGIADDWRCYRDARLREFAIAWCEENELEYVDDFPYKPRGGRPYCET